MSWQVVPALHTLAISLVFAVFITGTRFYARDVLYFTVAWLILVGPSVATGLLASKS